MQTRACEFQGSKNVTFHNILRKYEMGNPRPKKKEEKKKAVCWFRYGKYALMLLFDVDLFYS